MALAKKKRTTKFPVVNQHTAPDPRQALFLQFYFDLKSPTFSNALQSALKAGYAQEYAENLTAKMPAWLSESVGREGIKSKAEKHLHDVLNLDIIVQAVGMHGPVFEKVERYVEIQYKNGKTRRKKVIDRIPVMVPSTSIIKEKSKIAQFALEALHPDYVKKSNIQKASFVFDMKADKEKYK
jgi:phage terminase small subunit